MAQKCIQEQTGYSFWKKCTELLNQGWKVIPGTVVVSLAVGSLSSTEKAYVAFFTDGKDEK